MSEHGSDQAAVDQPGLGQPGLDCSRIVALYNAHQLREIEEAAARVNDGLPLMERAGRAAYAVMRSHWPAAERVVVVCGQGNNGGDGYVIARLARLAGLSVSLIRLGDPGRSPADAQAARKEWLDYGGREQPLTMELLQGADLVVDALFGIGLSQPLADDWLAAVEAINRHAGAVLSLDLPSGLDGDRGVIRGAAVRADVTVTFIALKRGLYTADGPDCCGRIELADLEIDLQRHGADGSAGSGVVELLRWPPPAHLSRYLPRRRRNSHKGSYGHLLVVGGDHGLGGAAILAATAALRCGCGRVTLATRAAHVVAALAVRPELMVHAVEEPEALAPLIAAADAVVIGPGLGAGAWGKGLMALVAASGRPLLVDADGLKMMEAATVHQTELVVTPHPGEAAGMLGCNSGTIQSDRFAALERLCQQLPGAAIVLKGCGSLIGCDGEVSLCAAGNAGMASAGMGDLLSGVIGALLARGIPAADAAKLGVLLHAVAGDDAVVDGGEWGMIASDLLLALRRRVGECGVGE